MKRRTIALVATAALAAAAYPVWWLLNRGSEPTELTLYGNVDLRQVELPFNNNERIAAVLVQEGDRVAKGQVLARLDTSRLEPQVAQAAAQVAAQGQVLARLRAGSRPEEIAEARANVASARADAVYARRQYDRFKNLSRGALSLQDLENAQAALDVAEARLVVNEKALDLAVLGPRQEDIAEAEARLHANEAQLAFLRRILEDAELVAPADAVVRSRVMEPGEMASPTRPVLILAILDPKWVRAYVSEPDLGRVRPGLRAGIAVDTYPARRLDGWIGFVSPVAEFTPKSVETEELRTSLVYEVRAFVNDPGDELRLGMPATVSISLAPVTTATHVALAGAGR
jgi:HlyD family secretion protein